MSQLDQLTCQETFRRLDDYVDRELSADEMQQVREHLDRCEWCASEYVFEEHVIQGVRERIRQITIPADLLSRISLALDRETVEPPR